MVKYDNQGRPYVTLEIDLVLPDRHAAITWGMLAPQDSRDRAREMIVEALKAYGGLAEGLLEAMGEL